MIRLCKLCGDFEAHPRSSFCLPCGEELDGKPELDQLEILAEKYTRRPLSAVRDLERGFQLIRGGRHGE